MSNIPFPDMQTASLLLDGLLKRTSRVHPCPVDRPLVLYGAGNMGLLAAQLLKKLEIPVEYAIDRSPSASRLLDGRITVCHPDEAPMADRSTHLVAVCTVFSAYEPIYAALYAQGWRQIVPFYDIAEYYVDRVPMGNGWFLPSVAEEEYAAIREVFFNWSDDVSRAAHLQFIAWRLHREEWEYAEAPVSIDDRYFIEPLRCRLKQGEEYFLDAGAYHGKVSEAFLRLVDNKYRGILAIEPDAMNVSVLREKLTYNNVSIMSCALGERSGTVGFKAGLELASRVMRSAPEQVQMCTLDEIDAPATFVKLHLEGGELEALKGGISWLKKRRPLLAITVYHTSDGVWKIPQFLMRHLESYRFLLRTHAWCGTGMVMYGVPVER